MRKKRSRKKITGMVSPHISVYENRCHCGCGQDIRNYNLYMMFERFRKYLNYKYGLKVTLIISNINRCKNHNWTIHKNNGMSRAKYMFHKLFNSAHVQGKAIDCTATGISPQQLIDSALECHSKTGILFGGLGVYQNWKIPGIHIDVLKFRKWND